MEISFSIDGIRKLADGLNQIINSFTGRGALSLAIEEGTLEAVKIASMLTHKLTGTLSLSHTAKMIRNLHGQVYIQPMLNPLNNEWTSYYGPLEHDRGGSHAFYARTSERGAEIANRAWNVYRRGLP